MSSWNKKWKDNHIEKNICNDDEIVSSLKQKKINKKRENPKHIPEFDNLYDRPQSSNLVEGFHVNEYLETVKKETSSKKTSDHTEDNQNKKLESEVRSKLSSLSSDLKGAYSSTKFDLDNSIQSLSNSLGQSLDGLSNLKDLGSSFSNMGKGIGSITSGIGSASDNIPSSMKVSPKKIQSVIDTASTAVNSVTQVITNIIAIIAQQIQIIRMKIQLFILKANKYVNQSIVRMAQALTQNTATEKEIEIFQEQTQQFITILMVWYFVYNWYYIIFFLEEEDNVRYKLQFGDLRKVSKYFYGFFGPALKPLELFNKGVLSMAILKKYLYTAMIMILMFFVFYTLVQNNFQQGILQDFFASMNGTSTMSLLSLFNMIIILYFSTAWFFGSMDDGNLEMSKILVDGMYGGIWTLFFSIVIFVLAFIGYYMWIMSINIPMGMVFLTGYLVLYTFFGVLFYEGFNMFSIYTGISESLDTVPPDLTPEPCKPSSPFLSFMWFKETFQSIIQTLGKLVGFFSTNMFDVIIILTLLGGIGVYYNQWDTATEGKVGISIFQATNLSSIFKNLFVWLILINVILLIYFVMFLYNKWKLLNNLGASMKADSTLLTQTSRSRMASARGSNEAPVTSKSKINALKQKIEKSEAEAKLEAKLEEDETKKSENPVVESEGTGLFAGVKNKSAGGSE